MGVEPPFLYDHPKQFSFRGPTDKTFNPKAATQASWTPVQPKPKQDGPLLNFNRHPDSVCVKVEVSKECSNNQQYLVVPYGNTTAIPMSPTTQIKVKRLRQFQLFLRLHQLVGALAALFCVIAINKTSGSAGWIIRVAPAVGLVHTLYAVYHLCRSPTGRTPGSTASYMVFAAMTDTGLLPFLVFSAFLAHSDYTSNAYGWGTLFGTDKTAYNVIHIFFLICAAQASMMLMSLILGIYLATMFRKISKLPPDMNPLEPNLTARPHKRNKSELTGSEKHISDSTYSLTKDTGPSITPSRRVPFMHTRTDSAEKLLYQNNSARGSRVDLVDPSGAISPTRPASALRKATNARQAGTGLYEQPSRSAVSLVPSESRNSWLSFSDYEGVPTPLSEEAEKQLGQELGRASSVSPVSSRSHSPNGDYRGAESTVREMESQVHDPFLSQGSHSQSNPQQQYPQPLSLENSPKKRSRDPLGMNPPSPLMIQTQYYDENQGRQQQKSFEEPNRAALQDTTANATPRPQHSRGSSFMGSGGKSRFYGNLRSSIGPGKRTEDEKMDGVGSGSDSSSDYERSKTGISEHSNFEVYGVDDDDNDDENYGDRNVHVSIVPAEGNWIANNDGNAWNGRNVSNSTGFDLHGGYAGLGAEFGKGMGRRREVSGKVAEEGRYFGNDFGGIAEEVKPVEQSPKKAGAAGWARFKGL